MKNAARRVKFSADDLAALIYSFRFIFDAIGYVTRD